MLDIVASLRPGKVNVTMPPKRHQAYPAIWKRSSRRSSLPRQRHDSANNVERCGKVQFGVPRQHSIDRLWFNDTNLGGADLSSLSTTFEKTVRMIEEEIFPQYA